MSAQTRTPTSPSVAATPVTAHLRPSPEDTARDVAEAAGGRYAPSSPERAAVAPGAASAVREAGAMAAAAAAARQAPQQYQRQPAQVQMQAAPPAHEPQPPHPHHGSGLLGRAEAAVEGAAAALGLAPGRATTTGPGTAPLPPPSSQLVEDAWAKLEGAVTDAERHAAYIERQLRGYADEPGVKFSGDAAW